MITTHYESDPRVRAIVVFGSLGRGNWDADSDIDLDIVIADDAVINVVQEVGQLCESFSALHEQAAIIIPDGEDACDVVLESLMQLSIRYHVLAQTHPNIVQSMQVLAGRLSQAAIAAAGEANRRPVEPPTNQLLDACVRYAAVAQAYLDRRKIWLAVEILHRTRSILMQIFARTHGGERAHQTFESEADPALQARLGATLPQYDLPSLRHSLEALLDIMQNDLEALTSGQIRLTSAHESILNQVRTRLANQAAGDESCSNYPNS